MVLAMLSWPTVLVLSTLFSREFHCHFEAGKGAVAYFLLGEFLVGLRGWIGEGGQSRPRSASRFCSTLIPFEVRCLLLGALCTISALLSPPLLSLFPLLLGRSARLLHAQSGENARPV